LLLHHYGQEDGFILLNCDHGGSLYTHHTKPNVGDMPFMKRHFSLATYKLMNDGKIASTGSSSPR
jgi:hypothetical protein